ncbi:MAG: LamG domain-containing protein [Candidatus Aenigmarchaeota archaeon]|nr:LamG domain-containing protein [Candidatus Aenigmarchaeota archaeon]
MSKAISTVIGTLLMLVITIGLFGFSYSYIYGVFTSKTSETFSVVDSLNDAVTISNDGTSVIINIKATLDGNSVPIAVVPNIQGLVGYWSFNEGSGTITNDNSGNKNIGTLRPSCPNCPAWVKDIFNNALDFDGVDDDVAITQSSSINLPDSAFSIAVWIKPDAVTTQTIIQKGTTDANEEFILAIINPGALYFDWGNNPYRQSSNNVVTANEWQFLVGVYDGGNTGRIFRNAVQLTPAAQGNAAHNTGTFDLQIATGRVTRFSGIIDEIGIYNRALSDSEITQLYSGLVIPGQLATVKPLATLTSGKHTLRLCTSSMCNTAVLHIQ